MPFKSQAQRRYMYATNPKLAKRFEEHTPKGKKLPEYVMDKISAHCTSKAKKKKKHTKIAAYEFILENHPLWEKVAKGKSVGVRNWALDAQGRRIAEMLKGTGLKLKPKTIPDSKRRTMWNAA